MFNQKQEVKKEVELPNYDFGEIERLHNNSSNPILNESYAKNLINKGTTNFDELTNLVSILRNKK